MIFDEIKGNFGFGCMRLPMRNGEVDHDEFCRMIDAFLAAGFNYFDTAHGYIEGKSERAIGACLSARYDRSEFLLADKLSEWYVQSEADIVPFFEGQLSVCGVDYFDFYLIHTVNRHNYEKYKSIRAFETVKALKAAGKLRHMAISFHDTADVLDRVLTEQPDIEAVQLQINYLDYDDPAAQSQACYEVAVKHGKPVIVMEPIKGGALVNLPTEAAAIVDALGCSQAALALRYAASHPAVFMVLSGMGNTEMMTENLATMRDFVPLGAAELAATARIRALLRELGQIPCTACNYCAEVCPMGIPISEYFAAHNDYLAARVTRERARAALPTEGATISNCIGCGACERVCPQSIAIPTQFEQVKKKLRLA